jgi:hypothetical protein
MQIVISVSLEGKVASCPLLDADGNSLPQKGLDLDIHPRELQDLERFWAEYLRPSLILLRNSLASTFPEVQPAPSVQESGPFKSPQEALQAVDEMYRRRKGSETKCQ